MPFPVIIAGAFMAGGLYVAIPKFVTGTTATEMFVKNNVPWISLIIVVVLVVVGIFGRK